jgi:large subunit ribosomal protein L6
MSRIGKRPITVPAGVEVKINGTFISVKGPKGALERRLHHTARVTREGDVLAVNVEPAIKQNARFHGLTRTLVDNMVQGVSTGYSKSLTLVGVGYRASLSGKDLILNLGFSHPINFIPPHGVEFKLIKQTTVIVSGPDKEAVGQVSAKIRGFRPPEPYHGKGVRYTEEYVATKVGKASGKK